MAHAQLSPSGWARWSRCPGSVAACDGLPDTSNAYSDEGTAAHAVLEHVLEIRYGGVFPDPDYKAESFIGERVNVANEGDEPRIVVVDADMAEHVQTVVDYVARRVHELSATGPVMVHPEVKVAPAKALGTEDCGGTADVVIVSDAELEVVDLKYGRGRVVEIGTPDLPNGQLMLYLLGAMESWWEQPGQGFRITIAQPRAPHADGAIRSLALGPDEVTCFVSAAQVVLANLDAAPGLRVAGEEQCQWCKAKRTCRAYAEWSSAGVGAPTDWAGPEAFATATLYATQDPATLDDDELVGILQHADIYRGFLNAVEEWAHEAMVKGTAPAVLSSTFKLVNGRSQRKWDGTEETIAEHLKKIRWRSPEGKTTGLGKREIYNEALKSPTQIEKLLKSAKALLSQTHWDAFNRLVTKPEGSLQLVPVTDPRPPAAPKDPAVMFPTMPVADAPALPEFILASDLFD
jgi:hypothetical protein